MKRLTSEQIVEICLKNIMIVNAHTLSYLHRSASTGYMLLGKIQFFHVFRSISGHCPPVTPEPLAKCLHT